MKNWFLATIAAATLWGMSMGACLSLGFYSGRWWGEWELFYLMDLPQGGVTLSHRTNAYWHKMPNDTLRFVVIPDPRQARTTQVFPQKQKKGKERPNEKAGDSGKSASGADGDKG